MPFTFVQTLHTLQQLGWHPQLLMILEKKKNGFAGSESGSRSKPNKKFPPLAPSLISSLRPASFTCLPPHKNPQKPPEAWFRLLGIAELLAGSIPPRILRSAFEISMKSGFSICLLFLLLIVSLLSPVSYRSLNIWPLWLQKCRK